ncbi:NUDIX hydrolase [Pseudogemmobacter bohemicus]|uniref:NUDIX hydrolase n=1 Tax=Pseudogemmobacter bohemicus TaxID=2250708 RepID=UPI000DD3A9A2|nr:NUDIX hydrolase [Pseudogemmobacter bohemicus]
MTGFSGAKAALFHREEGEARLLTYLRDDFPHLPWPGYWDLPGGGREGDESAETCLLRELYEEFGLTLPAARLAHRTEFPPMAGGTLPGIFFAAEITGDEIAGIRFGTEGQRWEMMHLADYLSHPRAIPALCERLRLVAPLYGFDATGQPV